MWYVVVCSLKGVAMCEFLIYRDGRVVMCVCLRRLCVDIIGGEGIYLFLVGPGCDECVWGAFLLCYLWLVDVYVVFC